MAKLDVAPNEESYHKDYKETLRKLKEKEFDLAERESFIRLEGKELSSSPAISVLLVSYKTLSDVEDQRGPRHLALPILSKDLVLFAHQILKELSPTTEDLILDELRSLNTHVRKMDKK